MRKKEREQEEGREGGITNCHHTLCGVHEPNWLSIKTSSPKAAKVYLKMLDEALELKSTQMSINKTLDKKNGLSPIIKDFATMKNNGIRYALFFTATFKKASCEIFRRMQPCFHKTVCVYLSVSSPGFSALELRTFGAGPFSAMGLSCALQNTG